MAKNIDANLIRYLRLMFLYLPLILYPVVVSHHRRSKGIQEVSLTRGPSWNRNIFSWFKKYSFQKKKNKKKLLTVLDTEILDFHMKKTSINIANKNIRWQL